jgi:hypothetical protein
MDERLQQQLKKLDFNNDGKVTIDDARELLERELATRSPKTVAIASFGAGAFLGFVVGRASK